MQNRHAAFCSDTRMIITRHTTPLVQPEEFDLLDEAYANWTDPAKFSDEKVAEIKTLLRRIMHHQRFPVLLEL